MSQRRWHLLKAGVAAFVFLLVFAMWFLLIGNVLDLGLFAATATGLGVGGGAAALIVFGVRPGAGVRDD
jgi:hypothetical protein